MTHDELLAKINTYTICTRETKEGMVCDNEHLKEIYPEWFALRAVVELHKQTHDFGNGHCLNCAYAGGELMSYPCPTIEAIEKELK